MWILDAALRKERRKRTLREVVGGGISRTRRKMGGQRPRHRKGAFRFLTPEMRRWGARMRDGKMKMLVLPGLHCWG